MPIPTFDPAKADIRALKQRRSELAAEYAAAKATDWKSMLAANKGDSPEAKAMLAASESAVATLLQQIADNEREIAATEKFLSDHVGGPSGAETISNRPTGRLSGQMFGEAARDMHGFKDPAEYFAVLKSGLHDPRLRAESMSGLDGSGGGFMIPPGVLGPMLDTALESEIVRGRATVWAMTTRERTVPAWDVMDRSDGAIAGFEIQWVPETGTIDVQVGKTRLIRLVARKGAIVCEASSELVADGIDVDTQLGTILIKALSFGLDHTFLFGTGAPGPLGALNSAAAVVVTKETNQGAGTIVFPNLTKMFSRLSPASVQNSVWVAHTSTIPYLSVLSIPVGAGGSHVPVMTGADGKFSILTRPVVFSEKMKSLGTQGDIALADFTQYTIGMRKEAAIERSGHVGFLRDVQTYRLLVRVDGQPNISAPYTPLTGETQSPFVVLETRS